MALSSIAMTYQELQEEFQKLQSKYANRPESPPLKIAVVGRGGHGKSTLINNLLNLEGEATAKAEKSAKPVTKVVAEYQNVVNGITVFIYDTPGLQDMTVDEHKVIKGIEKLTNGFVDLLFYVSSLNDRINDADGRIIAAITAEFRPQVWKNAVFVLTHADHYCNDDDKYIKYTDEFAECFQSYVVRHRDCRNMRVKCIQHRTEELAHNPLEITAIPTGLCKDENPQGWYYNLLIEAFNRCSDEATPLLLIATSVFGGNVKAANAAMIAGSAMQFGSVGATIGSLAGAITGGISGTVLAIPTAGLSIPAAAAAGGAAGAGVGAVVGSAVGAGVGTATVFVLYLLPIIKRKRLLEQLKKDQ